MQHDRRHISLLKTPLPQYAGQVAGLPPEADKKGLNKGLLIGCGALLVIAICVAGALWYVDANYLWCEVSWGLISGCP